MTEELLFSTRKEFRNWLEKNHEHDPIWLVFGKKDGPKTLHPDEALQEALCFGWIDGIIKRIDEGSYKKRFSHRRKNSIWSQRNKNFVNKLIKNNLMTKYGFEEIEKAKINGCWEFAERTEITEEKIEGFSILFKDIEPAYTNFINMSPSVKRIYTEHYSGAKKDETKKKRLEEIIYRLNKNLKPM